MGCPVVHGAGMAKQPRTYPDHGGTGPVPSDAPSLDRRDQDHLGQHLQAMYQTLLDEPVPPRFLMLIARLERQDREQGDER